MSDTRTEPLTDAEYAERIAELLGDPLPADWQDRLAVQGRQSHLAAVADLVGEAALETFAHLAESLRQGMTLDQCGHVLTPVTDEVLALDRAMRRYTQQTQRGDAMEVVQCAVETSAGATIAALVMGLIERVRAAEAGERDVIA